LWGNAISRRENHHIRDLGYPIFVKTDLRVRGDSLQIDPGVIFRICKGCTLYFDAKTTQVGLPDGKDVIFSASQAQDPWSGIIIDRRAKFASFDRVKFEDAIGFESDVCGHALVQVIGKPKISFKSLSAVHAVSVLETDLSNLDIFASPSIEDVRRECVSLF
jgi:hypothetical protein